MRILLGMSLALLLAGCIREPSIEIYNNSGAALVIYGQEGIAEIAAGESKGILFRKIVHRRWVADHIVRYTVRIKVGESLREYRIDGAEWWRAASKSGFTHRVQVELHGRILLLGAGVKAPAPADLPQPQGFPLYGQLMQLLKSPP